jgi:hypothetical protein
MIHFLLVFDRREGRVLSKQEFDTRSAAMAGRFEAERLHKDNPDVEVVVLGAKSVDALKRTHARYFQDSRLMYQKALQRAVGTHVAVAVQD